MPTLTAKKIAVLRDLIETRQRLAGAPRWLIRIEWWAERALRWSNRWYRRWALLRLAIAISVIVPVGWTIWTYTETLQEREQADRITALTLVNSNVPKEHRTVRQALAFLLSRKISLGGVNWERANLIEANLSGVILFEANLSGAKLNRANLIEANLSGADLSGANLSGADLKLADLFQANLSRANLFKANLSGADLRKANLKLADLFQANLSGAMLFKANLSGADLRKADLSGANLSLADLSGANLSGAGLFQAKLSSANLSGADLRKANLKLAGLFQANLSGAHLSGVKNLTQVQLEKVRPTSPPSSLPGGLTWPFEEKDGEWVLKE